MAVSPLTAFTFQPPASTVVALGVPKAYVLPTGSSPTTLIVTSQGPESAYISLTTAAASTTATQATVGASTIVVASASGIAVGQNVIAPGYIADGTSIPATPGSASIFGYPNQIQTTTVIGTNGTTITLSEPIIAAMSSTTVNFVAGLQPGTGLLVLPNLATPPLVIGSNTYLQMVCPNAQSKSILNVAVGV